MEKYLSINEFSKFSDIEKSTLRYWDEIGLFSPVKRDPENNYRYYSPDQLIMVNFIKVLSSLNVPLKTIGDAQGIRNPEKIIRLIDQQEKKLDMEMQRLRECYSIIHTRKELINYGIKVMDGYRAVDGVRMDSNVRDGELVDLNKVAVLYREDSPFILGPRNHFKENESFHIPFMNFCKHADELRINLSFPVGGYHENIESFLNKPSEPDNFISMDPTGNRKREAGYYLIAFNLGYYGKFGDLPKRLMAYAEENNLKLKGPVFTIYLHDEICLTDPSRYLVQICVGVEKLPKKRSIN